MLMWSVTGPFLLVCQRLKVTEYLVVLKEFHVTKPVNSMKPSPWEGDSPSVTQEVPCLLWNRHFHRLVYRSLPLDPLLNQVKPLNALHCIVLRSILMLFHLLYRFCSLIFSNFLTEIVCAFLISSISLLNQVKPLNALTPYCLKIHFIVIPYISKDINTYE